MIEFVTRARIDRSIEDVFAYVSSPENLPHWNSAVRAVRRTSAGEDAVGSTYWMARDLPTGPAENELEITGHEPPRAFSIRTTSGPTPFVYRYTFSPSDGGTLVELHAAVELSGLAARLGPLAKRAIKSGVDDNLRTLKTILERV